jgi:hypothetical protein
MVLAAFMALDEQKRAFLLRWSWTPPRKAVDRRLIVDDQ